MILSRRHFLGSTTSLVLTNGIFGNGAASAKKKRNLVVIMLRGGLDGLTAVPLSNSPTLGNFRPDLIVKNLRPLDSDFSLHPQLSGFHNLWRSGKAAVVHATNIPYTGRSHFDGQNLMESGGRIPYAEKTGWLGRGMEAAGLEGLAVSLPMPLLLRNQEMADNYFPSKWRLPNKDVMQLIGDTYKIDKKLSKTFQKVVSRPASMLVPTRSRSADQLAIIASDLLASEQGPQVAVFDLHGFDTHAAQGGVDGEYGARLLEVDKIFTTLSKNMKEKFDDTLVLTLTEFGRTLRQNSGYGTEHGYGTAILMAGGLIRKPQVFTKWPGIEEKYLFENRDLFSTIDARSIYCSAMSACFNTSFKKIEESAFPSEKLRDLRSELFQI